MAWITVALCTVLLVGHVLAAPLGPETTTAPGPLNLEALGFEVLADISCGGDVRFTSPTNINVKCLHTALKHFIKEFQKAGVECVDDGDNIPQTLEELEGMSSRMSSEMSPPQHSANPMSYIPQPPTACTLTTEDHKDFESFLKAAKDFTDQFNSVQASQKQ